MSRLPTRPRRYPIWSIPNITLVSVIVLTLTSAIIYLFGHRSLFLETEYVLAATSASLFTFLTVGLYHGARIRKDDLPTGRAKWLSFGNWSNNNWPDSASLLEFPLEFATDVEGCLAMILTGLLWIVSTLILVFLLWLTVNLSLAAAAILFLALAWLFARALRQVFRHSRTCRHRLPPSLAYASLYTLLYTGWLFALVQLTHLLLSHHHA